MSAQKHYTEKRINSDGQILPDSSNIAISHHVQFVS